MDRSFKKLDPIKIRRLPPEKTKAAKPETSHRSNTSETSRDRFGVPIGLLDYMYQSKETAVQKSKNKSYGETQDEPRSRGRYDYDYVNYDHQGHSEEVEDLVGRYLEVCSLGVKMRYQTQSSSCKGRTETKRVE